YYLRARYYNPTTGRFMSRDPKDGKLTDPKSLHKYLYADGDPVNRRDPLGREALIEYAFMTIGKPVGECLLQDEDSIGACLVDKAKDAAQEYWLGRIPNPGAGSAWAFGKQMGGCVIAAYTGIANVLNTIIEGGTVDQTVADQVGENLEECAYETVKEELGTVITTMLVPNPPE
ncbi:MAG: RHS repeat-associated core domain-containing protein, partial [Terracidiphilus sp.]